MEKGQFHHLFYASESKGETRGYIKFIGERLKAKWGNLWNWIKSKRNIHILLLHRWVSGALTINMIIVTMRGFGVFALVVFVL